jgi:hypothetical protein
MSAELDQLTAYGTELLAACRAQVDTLRVTPFGAVNASGRLKREMRMDTAETPSGYQLRILAPGYVLTLLFGRQPGKFPPLRAIQQWIIDKGLVPRPGANGKTISITAGEKGYSPLAYLIARKLADKGNTVHTQGPPSALFAAVLSPDQVTAAVKVRILPLLIERVLTVVRAA